MYVQNDMARSNRNICVDIFTHIRGCSISNYYIDKATIFMSKFLIVAISPNPPVDEKVLLC